MTFEVPADAYTKFMGRFSSPLAEEFVRFLDPLPDTRVVDVGCGPGALTAVLVDRLGADKVAAIDPSEPFVAAARANFPDSDVRHGPAEHLPWSDDEFDVSVAQLVVNFMSDPVVGLREMARVTRPGGLVCASVWDLAGDRAPLTPYWRGARQLDPGVADESDQPGVGSGQIVALMGAAGVQDAREHELTISVAFDSFEAWWTPYTFGVGPAGAHAKTLDAQRLADLKGRCETLLGPPPFVIEAVAWLAVGRA